MSWQAAAAGEASPPEDEPVPMATLTRLSGSTLPTRIYLPVDGAALTLTLGPAGGTQAPAAGTIVEAEPGKYVWTGHTWGPAGAYEVVATTGTGQTYSFAADVLPGLADWGGTPPPGTGAGDVAVDHDYGGPDAMRLTMGGFGVDGVTLTAWETGAYPNGPANAQTRTGADGRWAAPMMLDPGAYVLVADKPGVIQTLTRDLTVT